MTDTDLLGELRLLIGSPSVTGKDAVPNDRLLSFLARGFRLLAATLHHVIRIDPQFPLVANTFEYDLPTDFGSMVSVRWNDRYLQPASTWIWERDGVNYRSATQSTVPGNPTHYATLKRQLIVWPWPDTAAITTDPHLELRYMAVEAGVQADGVPFLADSDQDLGIYMGALDYCRAHPSDEMDKRILGLKEAIAERLPEARRRSVDEAEQFFPTIPAWTRRMPAGR